MISAEDDLRKWIRGYYYGGEVTDDTVEIDCEACIQFMRERGWHWDRVLVEPPDEIVVR